MIKKVSKRSLVHFDGCTSFFSTKAPTKTRPIDARKTIDATTRTGLNIYIKSQRQNELAGRSRLSQVSIVSKTKRVVVISSSDFCKTFKTYANEKSGSNERYNGAQHVEYCPKFKIQQKHYARGARTCEKTQLTNEEDNTA